MGGIRNRIPIPPIHPLRGMYRAFCRLVTRVFYRRCEVFGLERLPRAGAVVLCGNHPNALVDAVILQSVSPRLLHPLARSGLFKNPLLRPLLAIMQAVPIYRRQDQTPAGGVATSGVATSGAATSGAATSGAMGKNLDAFERCYDFLAAGEVLLIFPEGESHSDSLLRTFKTGAARIALGALARDGRPPLVLPVGLNFSEVGRFRSSVFVNFGEPVPVVS
ncbi:MAG: lysophospholipid acyltransferase family protein, partial [bacterium]